MTNDVIGLEINWKSGGSRRLRHDKDAGTDYSIL